MGSRGIFIHNIPNLYFLRNFAFENLANWNLENISLINIWNYYFNLCFFVKGSTGVNYEENAFSQNKKPLVQKRESNATSVNNRKTRSKSVTFLDEMETTDDENLLNEISSNNSYSKKCDMNERPQIQSVNNQMKHQHDQDEEIHLFTPNSNRRSLKNTDIRMHAGALTGVGPIRSIMKKSATDMGLNANFNLGEEYSETELQQETYHAQNSLPKIQLSDDLNGKSYVTPNLRKKHANVMQSDL